MGVHTGKPVQQKMPNVDAQYRTQGRSHVAAHLNNNKMKTNEQLKAIVKEKYFQIADQKIEVNKACILSRDIFYLKSEFFPDTSESGF